MWHRTDQTCSMPLSGCHQLGEASPHVGSSFRNTQECVVTYHKTPRGTGNPRKEVRQETFDSSHVKEQEHCLIEVCLIRPGLGRKQDKHKLCQLVYSHCLQEKQSITRQTEKLPWPWRKRVGQILLRLIPLSFRSLEK